MEVFGLLIGAVFFVSTIFAYSLGLKHGKQLQKGEIPHVEMNPVKVVEKVVGKIQHVQEKKQAKEEQDKMLKGLENLLAYDGSPQKEEGES